MRKIDYVYIPDYTNKNYMYESNSGATQLAFNYGCKLIFPKYGYKKEYKLNSPLEYYDGLSIKKEVFKDVFDERKLLIDNRNRVFYEKLNNIQNIEIFPIVKHKIPKKIYQTWESKDLSPSLYLLSDLVKKNNPEYEYNFI